MTYAYPTPEVHSNKNLACRGNFEPLTVKGTMRAVGHFFGRVYKHYQDRRSIAQLAGVEDRMLKDIGVTRGDVLCALEQHDGVDPSLHLADRARERQAADIAQRRVEWHWKNGDL
ncbi:DUF1127 domain-containing protein [Polycladidibacter hongkongensis]|uniref:DUF1127 domain-containing protein n=1 Tax=Polycladidibacter hongkongensis TaxID=1647556 RepID=UPI00082F5A1A|nr:DUF1127 domain-containing protein [Pseudovibrio hongkongensis]